MTIADSVERLLGVAAARRHVVVIDDGSDDGTPARPRRASTQPGLHVLRRDPPDARQGKAAALNHAYRAARPQLVGRTPTATR